MTVTMMRVFPGMGRFVGRGPQERSVLPFPVERVRVVRRRGAGYLLMTKDSPPKTKTISSGMPTKIRVVSRMLTAKR